MTEPEWGVPAKFLAIAADLDRASETIRAYLDSDVDRQWPETTASRELARAADFSVLPFTNPVRHAHLTVTHYMSSAMDHTTALAAVVRSPKTVRAVLTLLRTVLASASYAVYLADTRINLEERIRRSSNAYLDSITERMRLIGRSDSASQAEFDRLEMIRQKMAVGGRSLGWHVTRPATPASGWPKDWYLGDKPPGEGAVIDFVIGDAAIRDKLGVWLYRYLCATTHATQHSLNAFIDPTETVSLGDGVAAGTLGLHWDRFLPLMLSAMVALSISVDRCVGLFGWPPERWREHVMPAVDSYRVQLGVGRSPLLR